jgi:alpha-tubulin suppressor-like RCC1 family protein
MIGSLNAGLCGVLVLLLVSVAYAPTQAATLDSIDLTPANPAIDAGQSQAFVATGTFSDASTHPLESVPTAIAAGYYNGCKLLANGKVQCWGFNLDGELGNGTNTSSSAPVTVSGISTATALTTGYFGSCALLADGRVECWGGGSNGQLGNGTTTQSNVPVYVSGIDGVTVKATAIARGYDHACALLADETVQCWGNNDHGQLGNGLTTISTTPVPVGGITTATAISVGFSHTCALLADKTVKCWGYNQYGQLGDGSTTQFTLPVSVSGIDGTAVQATAIAAGFRNSCALLADGTVECWGDNAYGQLGNNSNTKSLTPVPVTGITTATEIVVGYHHSCALLGGETVKCWGDNSSGQLGDGSTDLSTTPVSVSGIDGITVRATALAAGYYHNCVLLASGQVQCWGYNQDGQLGSSIQSTTPVAVSGISAATGITAGDSHSCALSGGALQCWGYNQNGQLGNGTTIQHYATPVAVTGISTAVEVKGGGLHTCARLGSGAVQCWGYNQYGQLGDGSTSTSTLPVGVSGIDGSAAQATEIAAGYAHTCALLTDQTVKCWGDNSSDQLGVYGPSSKSTTPVAISGISGATAIAAGYAHTCALLADKTVKCWGFNGSGQLGNGTTASSATPVSVSSIDGTIVQATAISAGYLHTCALLADNTVQCWGDDSSGQLGNGATGQFNSPVAVSSISTATNIAAGGLRTCALLANYQVKCWGDNSSGQLGDGTTDSSTTPVSVSGIDGITVQATAIATGYAHTCALLSGGAEQCWGDNTFGQLGNGISAITTAPVYVSGAPEVVWSSSNAAVANIDANGVASALGAGSTTITATATDGSVNGSTTLYVNSYAIGGTVSGLTGSVVLADNGGDKLTVSADGGFTFAASLATGAAYNVSVATQPSGQTCVVSNPSGTVGSAAVTNVAVTCTSAPAYTIGGTVSGLTGSVSMKLTNNGVDVDNLTLAANGSFTFATALVSGTAYSVAVATQPSGQTCAITNGSGTVDSVAATSVTVSCTTNAPNSYTVGGTVSGLTGSVVLTNNGGDSLSVVTDGSFTFATALTGGDAYSVAVATKPSGQSCTVNNGSGTVGSADVTDVTVNCSTTSVAPLSTASGGGGGGAASPFLLGLLGLILSIRRTRYGRRGLSF